MIARAYYNDNDPAVARWLRELIARGLIAAGDVDDRSILDVRPKDLAGYQQCHFFAGIGGWSVALRLVGWPDHYPCWTGSPPCQPLSSAGQRKEHADERHVWPALYALLRECRPTAYFGEQVANTAGREWFAAVRSDLEAAGYASGAADLPAACIGSPHIRQRLFFAAERLDNAARNRRLEWRAEPSERGAGGGRGPILVGDALGAGLEGQPGHGGDRRGRADQARPATPASLPLGLADADGRDAEAKGLQRGWQHGQQPADGGIGLVADAASGLVPISERRPQGGNGSGPIGPHDTRGDGWAGAPGSFWRDSDWLRCRDERWRPVEPGTFPLAHGIPARVVRLRGYGNAIVPQAAAAFLDAYLETTAENWRAA